MNSCKICVNYLRLNRYTVYGVKRCFSNTPILYSFYERDRVNADYHKYSDMPWDQFFREGNKAFVEECKKLWQETKDHFQQDRKYYKHGDTEVFWRFDSEECLKTWRVTSDKTNREGNSDCKLIINDKKKAVFSGNIDLSLPKDGKKRFSGYCGIKSFRKTKSFFREDFYYFSPFTHLELRVRGDGRNYSVNLGVGMYYDINWFTSYTFAIFTHGGPYWQVIRIPFSQFFLTSKGRTQDKQCPIPLNRIDRIGITCAGVAGPFRLEIDYIGCHVDWSHNEISAYEMYKIPKVFVSY